MDQGFYGIIKRQKQVIAAGSKYQLNNHLLMFTVSAACCSSGKGNTADETSIINGRVQETASRKEYTCKDAEAGARSSGPGYMV